MLKKIVTSLAIITSLNISSMEQQLATCGKESEKECIARIEKGNKKLFLTEWVHLSDHFFSKDMPSWNTHGSCPDNSKKIILRRPFHYKHRPVFIVLDIQYGIKNAKKICEGKLEKRNCLGYITLSQSAKQFAFIYTKQLQNNQQAYFLGVQNIDVKEKIKRFTIPEQFDVNSAQLGFNKQDTHVIVHGTVNVENNLIQKYLIFPLHRS